MFTRREPQTIKNLRHLLVGDSRERERWMVSLIRQVREDERSKTLDDLTRVKDRTEAADR